MKRNLLWPRGLAVLLALRAAAGAFGQTPAAGEPTWDGLAQECPAGLDPHRWQRLLDQFKADGLPPASAETCLGPAREAARDGLPAEAVMGRLEEGATKRAGAEALAKAAEQRLQHLKTAGSLLREAGYGQRSPRHDELMMSVTLAMESGLSAPTLRGVLAQGSGGQSERLRSIVEAGETMVLDGMDEPTVGLMMTDFTQRNMRRSEIMRATRFAVQQHNARMEGSRIRQQLWNGAGSGGRWSEGGAGDGSGNGAGPGGGGGGYSSRGGGSSRAGGVYGSPAAGSPGSAGSGGGPTTSSGSPGSGPGPGSSYSSPGTSPSSSGPSSSTPGNTSSDAGSGSPGTGGSGSNQGGSGSNQGGSGSGQGGSGSGQGGSDNQGNSG
ncbi:MAG TPA: hypothetical protein PK634_07665, partial [Kiritimatiellia bacterium]|nr:hypothetical protein [Kiritimatiellia bacterium]